MIKSDRLFEVRFFDGLSADRRQELESYLVAFTQSLHNDDNDHDDNAGRDSGLAPEFDDTTSGEDVDMAGAHKVAPWSLLDPDLAELDATQLQILGTIPPDMIFTAKSVAKVVDALYDVQPLNHSISGPDPIHHTPSGGWTYLNLIFTMADLHRFNVTMPFVRTALRALATRLELSDDGNMLRRRPNASLQVDDLAALPLVTSSSSSSLLPPHDLRPNHNVQARAGTGTGSDSGDSSSKSNVLGLGRDTTATDTAATSASASQFPSRGGPKRASTQARAWPTLTAQDLAARYGLANGSSPVPPPSTTLRLWDDQHHDDSSSVSASVSPDEMIIAPPSRDAARGPVVFYRRGHFCTDLSASSLVDPPALDQAASLGLDSDEEESDLWPALAADVDSLPAYDIKADDNVKFNIEFPVADVEPRGSTRRDHLHLSSMTDCVPSDHFTLEVQTAHSVCPEDGPPSRKRKLSTSAGDPLYKVLACRTVHHLPSARPRDHAYLRRVRHRSVGDVAGSSSDSDVSGPFVRAPTIVSKFGIVPIV